MCIGSPDIMGNSILPTMHHAANIFANIFLSTENYRKIRNTTKRS